MAVAKFHSAVSTLNELIYYCKEPEPVGALLLTGEWGCGKTYLIEHELREKLENEAIIIRISLFGIYSLDEINFNIKKFWIESYCKNNIENEHAKKFTKTIKKGREWVSKLEFLPDWVQGIASTNWESFARIKPQINDKPVILVFDDLERCRMDSVDVLGCINDYCENKKFHTIIVANEDRINIEKENSNLDSEKGDNNEKNDRDRRRDNPILNELFKQKSETISYSEIKEKIIRRTVKYIPDYKAIVNAVVEDIQYENSEKGCEYKEFIRQNKEGLLELFAPDRNENTESNEDITNEKSFTHQIKRSHNIRSLKCAISDFYRVYQILKKNDFHDIYRWFYSFAVYVISYKANIVKDGIYGTILSDKEVKTLYPIFENKYIFNAVKDWILHGIWDEEAINYEVEIIKERERAESPADMIRTHRIIDIEEDIINEGFPEVLDMAYKGTLNLDEYVRLIMNSCWIRKYEFNLSSTINWDKVKQGISACIERLLESQADGQQVHSYIDKTDKKYFTDEEWNTYQIIDDFVSGNVLMFSKNRRQYIEYMKNDSSSAFMICQNKRYNIFDEEMATVTANAFERGSNLDKQQISRDFKMMWRNNINSQDMQADNSITGFKKLLELLQKQKIELQNKNKTFSICHTKNFIKNVEGLIAKSYQEECTQEN